MLWLIQKIWMLLQGVDGAKTAGAVATGGGLTIWAIWGMISYQVDASEVRTNASITRESAANMHYTDTRVEAVVPHIDSIKDDVKVIRDDTKQIREWVYDLNQRSK